MISREKALEAVVAILGVSLFVAIAVSGGAAFDGSGLGETGALVVVGGMVAFILSMAAVGYWLAGR